LSTSFCDFVRVCLSLCLSLSLSLSPNSNIQPKQYAPLTMSTNYHFQQSRASFLPHVMSKPFHVPWAVQPSGSKSIRTTCQPSDGEKLEASSCSEIPWGTWDQNLPSQNNSAISKSWLSNLSKPHLPKTTLRNLHRQQPSPPIMTHQPRLLESFSKDPRIFTCFSWGPKLAYSLASKVQGVLWGDGAMGKEHCSECETTVGKHSSGGWVRRKKIWQKNIAAIPGSFLLLAILAVEITHQARICDWVPTRSCVHATDHPTGHWEMSSIILVANSIIWDKSSLWLC